MPADGEGAEPRAGRRALWASLKAAVSAGLLAYLLWRGDAAALWGALRGAAPAWVLAALGLYFASHVLNARRWHRYAREFGFFGDAADFSRHYFAGLFVNLFMPGTVAGDLSRGLALAGGRRRAAALASVVAHRLTGMAALMVLGGGSALLQRQVSLPPLALAAAAVLPALAVAALLGAPSLVRVLAAWRRRAVALPASWASATARTLVVAVVYHALQIGSMILLARALGIDVAATTLGLFVPLVNAAGMVPVTVSGVGVREAGYVVLMGRIGVTPEQSLALGLLGSGLVFAAGLLGAPAFLSRPARSRREPG